MIMEMAKIESKKALADLKAGKKAESKPFYVCQNCGHTVEGEAPDKCPICGTRKDRFVTVA